MTFIIKTKTIKQMQKRIKNYTNVRFFCTKKNIFKST